MSFLTKTIVAATLILTPVAASAATFNFTTLADAFKAVNGYEGTFDQATGGSWIEDGITVSTSATGSNGARHCNP